MAEERCDAKAAIAKWPLSALGRAMIKPLALAMFCGLAACAQFPDVDRAETSRAAPPAPPPRLVPVEILLDEGRFSAPRADYAGNRLEKRAAALRQRAAALRRAKPAG